MTEVVLDQGESVIKVVRKHPFYIILQAVVLFIAGLVPVFLQSAALYLIAESDIPAGDVAIAIPLIQYGAALWYLFLWMRLFVAWTDYYLDRWIITDRRIIASEQNGLFNRETSTVRHDKIQDVKADVKGFIATILDFGTITVQTAGSSKEFILTTAPSPYRLKEILSEAHDQAIKQL